MIERNRLEDSFSRVENQRRTMEDAFFLKEEQKIIEKLRTMKQMKETKETLSRVSGIRNDSILQKLVDLNVRPETLASLSLIPLVFVAWADGEIDKKEESAILKAVHQSRKGSNNIDLDIIEGWMKHEPPQHMMDAWIAYIGGLCELLTEAERKEICEDIVMHARSVAEASGGFLGLVNKISSEEAKVLRKCEEAFIVCGFPKSRP